MPECWKSCIRFKNFSLRMCKFFQSLEIDMRGSLGSFAFAMEIRAIGSCCINETTMLQKEAVTVQAAVYISSRSASPGVIACKCRVDNFMPLAIFITHPLIGKIHGARFVAHPREKALQK